MSPFNPCAFFVLLFLLSLLVHARRRRRMLLIGGVFILTSGIVYFLFMTAWLNAFRLLGELHWVTSLAGALAVVIGGLNVKDYFWFHQGPSLSIPAWNAGKESFPHSAVDNTAEFNRRMRKTARPVVWEG